MAKWLLVSLTCLALWPAHVLAQAGQWESYRDAGIEAFLQGDYAEAEKEFAAALNQAEQFGPEDPRLGESLNGLGEVYRAQGKYDDAERSHKRALAVREKALGPNHPDVAQSLNNLAEVYRAQGMSAEAEPLRKRALAIEEALRKRALAIEEGVAAQAELWQSYMAAGIVSYQQGRYDRAIEDYTAALRIEPDNHDALYNRGIAWQRKGEYDRAIEDYTAALRIEPDNHESLNGLAWVLATAPEALVRDGSRAVRLAEKAISLQGTANNHDTLAAAYAEAGRFTDAVGTQERSLAMARAEGSSAEELADFHDRLRLYRQGRPYREQR